MINTLILVGSGHMGFAMLRRWVDAKAARTIYVVTPERDTLKGIEAEGVRYAATVSDLPADIAPDAIMFAVKPQIIGEVVKEYKKFASALFLSVAAGMRLDFYASELGDKARVIRVMPNLAAKCGEGATLLVKNPNATAADTDNAEELLGHLGLAAWLENEELMDAATALSGCGPAYFYLMADLMAKAGAKMGLPAPLAAALAKQTLIGSAALWRGDETSATTLYQNIAVKGGMTEAALKALLEDDALKSLMEKALAAAAARGKELAR